MPNNYIVKDVKNTETEYLKNGIVALFECLKEVKKYHAINKTEAKNEIYRLEKERINRFKNKKEKEKEINYWINDRAEKLVEDDVYSKNITEEVLISEIAEFKTRLGRVNITVITNQDTLDFKKTDQVTELHIYEREVIKNPYPDIFVDADAFVLFNDLHSIYRDCENPLANYSFIYRQMSKDKLIKETFKPEKFRDWINSEPYNLEVDTKLKTYDKCYTKEKYNIYQFAKSKR